MIRNQRVGIFLTSGGNLPADPMDGAMCAKRSPAIPAPRDEKGLATRTTDPTGDTSVAERVVHPGIEWYPGGLYRFRDR
jgi:hypothetical protein